MNSQKSLLSLLDLECLAVFGGRVRILYQRNPPNLVHSLPSPSYGTGLFDTTQAPRKELSLKNAKLSFVLPGEPIPAPSVPPVQFNLERCVYKDGFNLKTDSPSTPNVALISSCGKIYLNAAADSRLDRVENGMIRIGNMEQVAAAHGYVRNDEKTLRDLGYVKQVESPARRSSKFGLVPSRNGINGLYWVGVAQGYLNHDNTVKRTAVDGYWVSEDDAWRAINRYESSVDNPANPKHITVEMIRGWEKVCSCSAGSECISGQSARRHAGLQKFYREVSPETPLLARLSSGRIAEFELRNCNGINVTPDENLRSNLAKFYR